MAALGLSMDELGTFSDQMAVTAQKSNTSVGQLGEAILTVGGTAKQLKGGTAELNAELGMEKQAQAHAEYSLPQVASTCRARRSHAPASAPILRSGFR